MAFKKRLCDRYINIKREGEHGHSVEMDNNNKGGYHPMAGEPVKIKREEQCQAEIRDCMESIVNAVADAEGHNLGPLKKRKRTDDQFERRCGREFVDVDWETDEDDDEKTLLRKEIRWLKSNVKRLVQRQELLEDFGMMQYGNRFKTFYNAREKLLELGKMQVGSYPELVLSPGSPHLINVLTRICDSKNSMDIKLVAEEVASEYLNLLTSGILTKPSSNNTQQLHPKAVSSEKPASGPIADFLTKNSHLIPKTKAPCQPAKIMNPFFTTLPSISAPGTGTKISSGTQQGILSSDPENIKEHIMQRPKLPSNPTPSHTCISPYENTTTRDFGATKDPGLTIQQKKQPIVIRDELRKLKGQMLLKKKLNLLSISQPQLFPNGYTKDKGLVNVDYSSPAPGAGQNQTGLLPNPFFATSTPNFQFSHLQAFPLASSGPSTSKASLPSSYTNTSQVYLCTGQNPNNFSYVSNGSKNSSQNLSRPKKKAKRRKGKKQTPTYNANLTPIGNRSIFSKQFL